MCNLRSYFCCVQLSSCLQTLRIGGASLLVCSLLFRIAAVRFMLVLVACVCVKHGRWNKKKIFLKITTSGIFMVVFHLSCSHVVLLDFLPWAFRCKMVLLLFTCVRVRLTEPSCCCYHKLFPHNRRMLAW